MTVGRLAVGAGNGVIGTAATLYTASGPVVSSTLVVCNAGTTSRTFTVAIHTGTSFSAGSYLIYQATVNANDSVFITAGLCLDATNKYLLVSSSHADVNFSLFGDA